ncbi:MAG: threonine synthase [Candidatus Aquicultorales bacterium]
MSFSKGLRCRECGLEYPLEATHVCEFCFGPLEVVYDYDAVKGSVSREGISSGPRSIWRYAALLPADERFSVDFGTGFTPLIKATNLAEALGLSELYLKNDTVNPTGSFKDRVVSVALAKALEFGYDTVACASTGNLANSVAAHAAKAGLASYIFIPADLEAAKVLTTAVYGATLVPVSGNYDAVNRLCSEISSEFPWAFVNINVRPYYSEGSKTLAYETAEQLGWDLPDHVVVPIASGSLLTKIKKGFEELVKVGLVSNQGVRISGAQATGCSPVSTAVKAKSADILPVKPETIAKSLAIGNPADGYYASRAVAESGGFADDVSDAEIIEAIKLLAETEGIFAETAGGVSIGVLKKLVEDGRIAKDEKTVVYITGNGLKTVSAIADHVAVGNAIDPSLEAFYDAYHPERSRL